MTFYQTRITALLGVAPLEAAFIEAHMRATFSTLDGLHATAFKRAAKAARNEAAMLSDADNVRLAQSYGLLTEGKP